MAGPAETPGRRITGSMSGTYLDRILAAHRAAAATDPRALESLVDASRSMPPARGFAAALSQESAAGRLAVIAEVKRRSPSKGDLDAGLVPDVLAKAYAAGGATCLSVLTDAEFFGGSEADLTLARDAVGIPVLRKDFTVSEADVCDARIMGADAVLLIAAALDDSELRRFSELAGEVGLDALVEIHDEAELERALAVGARLIGVNQRDLVTFEVDTNRAERVAKAMPDGIVKVAESGVRTPTDALRLREAGFDAVLVGEALVRSGDPATAVGALRCS
jgi:indole-3-glycerol phosphate synthase